MYITWQSVVTASAVVAAVIALFSRYNKVVKWVDKQNEQDDKIEKLSKKTDERFSEIAEEQTLLTYGVLACLKGLSEQGCDGPVNEAIQKIDKHLNQKAHKI